MSCHIHYEPHGSASGVKTSDLKMLDSCHQYDGCFKSSACLCSTSPSKIMNQYYQAQNLSCLGFLEVDTTTAMNKFIQDLRRFITALTMTFTKTARWDDADSNYALSTLGFLHSLVWIMSTMQKQPSAMSNRQEHRIFRCNGMTRKINTYMFHGAKPLPAHVNSLIICNNPLGFRPQTLDSTHSKPALSFGQNSVPYFMYSNLLQVHHLYIYIYII